MQKISFNETHQISQCTIENEDTNGKKIVSFYHYTMGIWQRQVKEHPWKLLWKKKFRILEMFRK